MSYSCRGYHAFIHMIFRLISIQWVMCQDQGQENHRSNKERCGLMEQGDAQLKSRSCSDGQKVIRTQVSPLSIIVDGGKSASPAWVVVRRVHQAESQVKGHQKGQYLGRMRSELCTTCCSIACNAPPHLPNTTCFSQTYNQLPLLCLFQACPA